MSRPESPTLAAVLAKAVAANPGWSQPDDAVIAYRYTSPTEQGGPAGPWATVHRRMGWWVHTVWADADGKRLLEEARFGYGSPGINDQGVHGCCGCCIPPGQRPHAVTAACRDEHCTYHQVDEPAVGAYRVCVECGHAFMSEDELRAAFAAAPPGDGPAPPGDQIDFCPLCAHDF